LDEVKISVSWQKKRASYHHWSLRWWLWERQLRVAKARLPLGKFHFFHPLSFFEARVKGVVVVKKRKTKMMERMNAKTNNISSITTLK